MQFPAHALVNFAYDEGRIRAAEAEGPKLCVRASAREEERLEQESVLLEAQAEEDIEE